MSKNKRHVKAESVHEGSPEDKRKALAMAKAAALMRKKKAAESAQEDSNTISATTVSENTSDVISTADSASAIKATKAKTSKGTKTPKRDSSGRFVKADMSDGSNAAADVTEDNADKKESTSAEQSSTSGASKSNGDSDEARRKALAMAKAAALMRKKKAQQASGPAPDRSDSSSASGAAGTGDTTGAKDKAATSLASKKQEQDSDKASDRRADSHTKEANATSEEKAKSSDSKDSLIKADSSDSGSRKVTKAASKQGEAKLAKPASSKDSDSKSDKQAAAEKAAQSGFGRALFSGFILALVAVLCTSGVLYVQHDTAPLIEGHRNAAEQEMVDTMLPDVKDIAQGKVTYQCKLISDKRIGKNMRAYVAVDESGNTLGVITTYATARGYSNPLVLIAGINNNGKITKVDIQFTKETPGIGDKVERKRSNFLDQFDGHDLESANWDVKKFGGDFDYFTGATVTSRAVVLATSDLLKAMRETDTSTLPDCKAKK